MNNNIAQFSPANITAFKMLEEFNPNTPEYFEQPNNAKDNLENAVYALLKIADFISKGLLEKLNKSAFGFNEKNSEALVNHCLNDMYRYDFPFIMRRGDRHTPEYRDDQRKLAVENITALAEHMASKIEMKRIVKSRTRFVLPKGMQITDAFLLTFPGRYISDLRNLLQKFEGIRIENTNVFDVQKVIMQVLRHTTLVDSLVHPNKISLLKDFVADKLENDLSYFINGYPHDIFVVDRQSMGDRNLTSIYVNEERCISYVAFDGKDCESDSCTLKVYENTEYRAYG